MYVQRGWSEGENAREVRARAVTHRRTQAHVRGFSTSRPRHTRALGNVRERKKGGKREGERTREGDVENTLYTAVCEQKHRVCIWRYIYTYAHVYYMNMYVTSCVCVCNAFPSAVFSLIASSSRRDKRRLCRVAFATYPDTLLEEASHTGVKNRGKSIVERRGAPVATTETAWQSPSFACLSLSVSSLVLSSFLLTSLHSFLSLSTSSFLSFFVSLPLVYLPTFPPVSLSLSRD